MLLLTLGLAQAPRVCVGDGNGGACRPEACACVAACSCQAAHRRDTAAQAAASDCCAVAEPQPASCHSAPATEASACHGPGQWPHFAPSDRHWFALVPDWPVIALEAPETTAAMPLRDRAAHRTHAPPERPPRLLG